MSDYGTVTGAGEVRFERLLPGPIERVWAYVTESEKRAKWLAGGEIDLRVGGHVALHFRHADLDPRPDAFPEKYKAYRNGATIEGRVTRCEPPRLLAFTCGMPGGAEHAPDSEVTFELAPRGNKVTLMLTHRRLGGRDMMVSVSAGWHVHLGIMSDLLNGATPEPFWAAHARLEAEYGKQIPA